MVWGREIMEFVFFHHRLLFVKDNIPAVSKKSWWCVPGICCMMKTRSSALLSSCKVSSLLLTNFCYNRVVLAVFVSGLQLASALPELLRHFLFAFQSLALEEAPIIELRVPVKTNPHPRQSTLFPIHHSFQIKGN